MYFRVRKLVQHLKDQGNRFCARAHCECRFNKYVTVVFITFKGKICSDACLSVTRLESEKKPFRDQREWTTSRAVGDKEWYATCCNGIFTEVDG